MSEKNNNLLAAKTENENEENINTTIQPKEKYEKIIKKSRIKFFYGNPENEFIEGTLSTISTRISINNKINLTYEELEIAKQYIWEFNLDNSFIKSKSLCCTNLKNKFSINQFVQSINIYLSYISSIHVFKSSIPNIFYVYLNFKNVEYCNVFYNTYQYSNISTIDDDYLLFDEVVEIKYDELFSAKSRSKNFYLDDNNSKIIKSSLASNLIFDDKELEELNNKKRRKLSYEYDINTCGIDEIRICTICLEDLNKNTKKTKNDGLIYVLCGHVFHLECFVKLDDNKCPICRYNLSPHNIVTCENCFREKDLWICLICWKIFCGEEGESQNHRLKHYQETSHSYTQGIGKNQHIIYDFSKNVPVHIWIQNTVLNSINENNNINNESNNENKDKNVINDNDGNENNNSNNNDDVINTSAKTLPKKTLFKDKNKNKQKNSKKNKNNINKKNSDKSNNKNKNNIINNNNINNNNINNDDEDDINEIFKSSKEKTQYIISQYNSIISSQLENQRYYYLNEFKRRKIKYINEKKNIQEEISKAEVELKSLEKEEEKTNEQKKQVFDIVKEKNNQKILVEKELEQTEKEYNVLKCEKSEIDKNSMNKTENIEKQIEQVDNEIKELNQQLKELNIHINTLNSLEKSDPQGIKNSSLGLIMNVSGSGGHKKKKHH